MNDKKDIWWKLAKSRHYDSNLLKQKFRQKSTDRKNRNDRDQSQEQREMLKIFSSFKSRYNQQDDEYNFRSNLQLIFVFAQFSNFVSQYSVSQTQYSNWQNRAYQNQQQSQRNQFLNDQSTSSTLSSSSLSKLIIEALDQDILSNASNFNFYQNQRQSFRRFDDNRNSNRYSTIAQSTYWDSTDKENREELDRDDSKAYYDDEKYYDDESYDDDLHDVSTYTIRSENYSDDVKNHDTIHDDKIVIDALFFELTKQRVTYACRLCKKSFVFNNKLHRHVRKCRIKSKVFLDFKKTIFVFYSSNASIIESIVSSNR